MQIVVSLSALTGSFDTDIQRSARSAERALKRMESESRKSLAATQKAFNDTGNRIKGFVAGFLTIGAIVGVARSVVRATVESEKAAQNLESALRGTRGATADTANQLKAYAEELQRTTIFEDDAIVSAEALIASFRNIGADEIPRATRAVADLSAAFGRDLRSSAELVGKALNDPTKATRALREAHVALSPAVQKTIKELVETGRIVEAQNIVLSEFERAVGGRAVDATRTLGGALAQLKNAFGNLLEAGGTEEAVESVNELTRALQSPSTQRAFQTFTKFLVDAAAAAVKFGADVVNAIAGVNSIQIVGEAELNLTERALRALPDPLEAVIRKMIDIRRATLDAINAIDELSPKLLIVAERAVSPIAAQGLIQRASQPGQVGEGLIPNLMPRFLSDAQLKAAEKARQEARRIQEAFARGDAEIFQAMQDRERQALEASLDARAISYRSYLDEKLRLTEAEIDQEIQASKALLQNAEADEAVLLQARIKSLEIRREIAREERENDEAAQVREIASAYDEAARSAQSYLDAITRQGQRELLLLDANPAQRRFASGQFQIDDRLTSEIERLNEQGLDQSVYDEQLQLLKTAHADQSAEWTRYFNEIEAKQKDFTTSFSNSINEYLDATSNVGAALGDTLVSALDQAADSAAHLAAEFILFGEGGKDAIYQIARSLATTLLQELIKVGIQLLIIQPLLKGLTSGGGGIPLPGRASGGYAGDLPENKIAGVYHGKEFIVNAQATREHRDVLEAINDGTYADNAASVPRASSPAGKSSPGIRIINVPDKSYIKDYLMGDEGDEVFTNWVGRNSAHLKQAVAS